MNAEEVAIFGARPLRRYVDQKLGTDIARLILKGELERGSTLEIDYNEVGLRNRT